MDAYIDQKVDAIGALLTSRNMTTCIVTRNRLQRRIDALCDEVNAYVRGELDRINESYKLAI